MKKVSLPLYESIQQRPTPACERSLCALTRKTNVTAYMMSQADVEGKFKTLTNGSKAAATITQMAKTFVALCSYADWSAATVSPQPETSVASPKQEEPANLSVISSQEYRSTGFDLNYDIHIHLPATRDQAVYDALFASLAKHIPLK